MNTIYRLREVLSRVLSSPQASHDEQELFDELMVQKPRLLKLFDVGPRNPQEQKEIELGKPILNNKATAVNADFVRQTIFLSYQLGCSEKYIASTLHDVMAENPNIAPVFCLEMTVANFHERRRHLIDCLRFLLEATEAAEVPDAPSTYLQIAKFVKSELLLGTRTLSGEVTLAAKLFREIEQLETEIGKTDMARKNAGSSTVFPTGQGMPTLGFDILNARHESLKYERRYIGVVLCSISRLGYLGVNEVKIMVDWLSSNSNSSMTYYLLTAVSLLFDPIDPLDSLTSRRQALATDSSLLAFMTKKLETSTKWKDEGLKAVVLLKWTMFLTEARYNDTTLETKAGFKTEELEIQVWNAVQGSAFSYLAQSVLHLRTKGNGGPAAVVLELLLLEQQEQREVPPDDFRLTVLDSFETLVRSVITHASSELRKIKQKQEDLILANVRTDRNRTASRYATTLTPEADKPDAARHDIAMLYTFIGLLYSALPPERSLQFWGAGYNHPGHRPTYQEAFESTSGRLPAFLQWAVWSTPRQDSVVLSSLYDMLCGLATGQQCSELAYNFLARGANEVLPGSLLTSSSSAAPPVSWTAIFGTLESWAANAANPQPQPKPAMGAALSGPLQNLASSSVPQTRKFLFGQRDIFLARSSLRLLATVAQNSVVVRTTIAGHGQFRAIPTLLSLVPLSVPLELKGAIFDTVAAFCEPGAGAPGVEICKAIWTLMERLEVINVRVTGGGGLNMALTAGKGVEVELEQVESVHQVYPATIPFLKLLGTLIHTPKQISLQDFAMGKEPLNTIPENLGQPYRLPGISPFTSFVIDNVFANIPSREYSRPSDRWQTNDLCLGYLERSLASFNLELLVSGSDGAALKMESMTSLAIHPGYEVIKRLLTNTPLQASILSYIVEGLAGFERGFADEEPFFRSTIIRVLRIVYRVLEIQDIFLDVFIPLLSEFNNASSLVGQVHSRSFFTRFDQALSFGVHYIPAIASYMSYPTHSELVLLSIKIIAKLSLVFPPSTLVPLIQSSQDSDRILAGFTRIVGSDSADDVDQAEEYANRNTGAGSPTLEHSAESLEQAIRLAALDLIIQDTETNRPYPNITHFLLFGGEQTIQDPHALGARQTSIHVLLELVNTGVPRLRGKRKDRSTQEDPLFITLPALGERCYKGIYQLCVHGKTSDFTTRYLRTREDFFARQIARVTSAAPAILQEPVIQVVYADGLRVTTTVASLTSFLHLRSYIFDLVALELHLLTNKGHHKAASELLEILFGTDVEYDEEHNSVFHELGQSPMRVIGFLQSLIFDWADSLSVAPTRLEIFGQLDFQSCIRKDASGCDVIDRAALLTLLTSAGRTLHAQGFVATQAQHDQLTSEMTYILESCAIENHRRKVSHARIGGFEAWRRMLDLALTKCFDRLPHDRREDMLFDLLYVLPAAIRSGNIEESTCILLSETILSAITKMREDRQQRFILQTMRGDAEADSLPAERLYNILRNMLEGILDNSHVELVRGNLYAALINFINLIRSPTEVKSSSSEIELNPFTISLAASTMRDGLSASVNRNASSTSTPSEKLGNSASALELGCLAVMKPVIEKLIAIVARDAIDGSEVWKSIAFMLLDALVQLSGLEKQHVVLSALNRHGILANFVSSLKDSDGRLQAVLKPDPDDLNALYVYEAKMSLLIRMAQTRLGAERLLDVQLLPILSQCDYLDTRPEADHSFIDQDSFLPSAIQRYHQLFMPAMQVSNAIISSLGHKHTTAKQQALGFLSGHGPTIAILLKSDLDYATIPALQEIHLLVSLCTSILPSVPKTELLSANSGFGAIHLAILGLSTRCLASGKLFAQVVPQTEQEVKLSQQYAFGYGNQTKFDVIVKQRENMLRKVLVSYVGASSDFAEPDITLVLSPITITVRNENRAQHFAGTIPTIGDAIIALDDLCNDLTATLKQISDISAELVNKNQMGLENVQEILRDLDPSLLRTLDLDQKRALVAQSFISILTSAKLSIKIILDTLDMLLLILWRHLEYYTDESHMGAPSATTTVGNAMRLLATAEPEVFRKEVANKIGGTLTHLGAIELDGEALGRDYQGSQGYIRIMCRRLRDSTGLHEDPVLGEMNE